MNYLTTSVFYTPAPSPPPTTEKKERWTAKERGERVSVELNVTTIFGCKIFV